MINAHSLGRLGLLAVGLGIGTAVATSPGIASADSSDWLSSIDNLVSGLTVPALSSPDLNLAISVDGYSLFQEGSATATSSTGDIAIAYGDNADASATGGILDFAFANGAQSDAAVSGSFDTATATGAGAGAAAGFADAGATGGDFDYAAALGNWDEARAGIGSYDAALVVGNENQFTPAQAFAEYGNGNLAVDVDTGSNGINTAEAGGFVDTMPHVPTDVLANNDVAVVVGDNASAAVAGTDFATGIVGNFDLAAVFGDTLEASAGGSNYLVDILPSL